MDEDADYDNDLNVILEAVEAWQDSREGIRQRAAAWISSPAFVSTFYDNAHPPANAEEVLKQAEGAKEAAQKMRMFRAFGEQSPSLLRGYRDLATTGRVVFAHGVISNPALSSHPEMCLPCLFLSSFDQGSAAVAAAGILSQALGELYVMETGKKEHPICFKLVRDDEFRLFRRRKLPAEETHGLEAMLLDIQIRKSWMPPPALPFVPLLMNPGRQGAVVQIPWYVVQGERPRTSDAQTGIWHEIAEMGRKAPKVAGRGRSTGAVRRGAASVRPTNASERPFSIRLFLLRLLSVILVAVNLAVVATMWQMGSQPSESDSPGFFHRLIVSAYDVDSSKPLDDAQRGLLVGRGIFTLILSLLTMAWVFWRRRILAIIFFVLLLLSGGYSALPGIIGLILCLIPGRSPAWSR